MDVADSYNKIIYIYIYIKKYRERERRATACVRLTCMLKGVGPQENGRHGLLAAYTNPFREFKVLGVN